MHRLLSEETGRRELLLGNEAVVRGAIEARVRLVCGYPGTPASEIGDTFHELHRELGVDFEYSVNEKVALELAFGAALTGARCLVAMKHLGLNYGADPLSTMPYTGVVGGMVIVSAADPGCLTSPNEQDQRYLARMLGLPTLDPANPEEARRMTVFAFELSEACELPVLLRMTTRVCHTRAPVELGAVCTPRPKPTFRRDPARFLPTPNHARELRERLERRLEKAAAMLAGSGFDRRLRPGRARHGILAAGCPRNAVRDSLSRAGADVPLLEIGGVHPFPEEAMAQLLRDSEEVLVVEELSPFLEDTLRAVANQQGLRVAIRGKRDGAMPLPFELEPEVVEARLRRFLGLADESANRAEPLEAPERPPVLCPGCPHRNTFHAATAVFGERTVYVNDIGCYTLGANPPHGAGDVLLAMGSSLPIAAGIARSTGERVVAFIGDSTFFHSGMPALLDALDRRDDIVVVVMDNRVTAMTGLQPSPTSGRESRIAGVARALGAPSVEVVKASELPELIRAFSRARSANHPCVVVVEGPCALLHARSEPPAPPPRIDPTRCHTCGMIEAGLSCGLEPSVEVQRRVAEQRAAHPAPELAAPSISPCSLACPLGICVPAYVGAVAAGDPGRALQAVTLRAALPSVCSHLCHRPCEDSCVRAPPDRPVAVNALKRYLTERHLSADRTCVGAPPRENPPATPRVDSARTSPQKGDEPSFGPHGTTSDASSRAGRPARNGSSPASTGVAVIGAGPAGLAAARELVRRGRAATIFDARQAAGGMLEHAVPEYRLPREVLRRDVASVLAEGVRFEPGVCLGRDVTLESLRRKGFQAILLALGAQRALGLSIPGAGLAGVQDALAFLSAPGRILGEHVVVLGGGDVAVDLARVALRGGAASAALAFPEPEGEMAAAPDAVAQARAEGVRLLPGRIAAALEGTDAVRAVALSRVIGFERGGGGVHWQRLEPAERLAVTRIFFAVGQRLDIEGLQLPSELVTSTGWLAADECGRTAWADVFAAGDAVSGPSTVTQAMAFAVRAAWAIDAFLAQGGHVSPPSAPPLRPRPPRRVANGGPRGEPLDSLAAAAEASRCYLCGMCGNCRSCVELLGCPAIARGEDGRPRIIGESCNACGACVQACPSQAIGAGA
ncbi:MAG: FAD-dependent oxidoreductase [Myxococcales bacterium]|nr:FAD-dependent oxidoreductase [Myxococcales bacterium]